MNSCCASMLYGADNVLFTQDPHCLILILLKVFTPLTFRLNFVHTVLYHVSLSQPPTDFGYGKSLLLMNIMCAHIICFQYAI